MYNTKYIVPPPHIYSFTYIHMCVCVCVYIGVRGRFKDPRGIPAGNYVFARPVFRRCSLIANYRRRTCEFRWQKALPVNVPESDRIDIIRRGTRPLV